MECWSDASTLPEVIVGKIDQMFKATGNVVLSPNGKELCFAYPVMELLEDGDRCYIFLDVPRGVVMHDNVSCLDSDGAVLWHVENKLVGDEWVNYIGGRVAGEYVELWNADGWTVRVDRETGTIHDLLFTKGVDHNKGAPSPFP